MKLRILLVEDDHMQRKSIQEALEEKLEGVEVETKASEWEFRRDFEAIASTPPKFAVIDVMLRWASPSRDAPDPPSQPWDSQRAGLRCAQWLHDDSRTVGVKLILYTIFDHGNMHEVILPQGAVWLTKELSPQELVDTIKRLLPASCEE
jgi:DNA-binding NarL/FixJ family response regulator